MRGGGRLRVPRSKIFLPVRVICCDVGGMNRGTFAAVVLVLCWVSWLGRYSVTMAPSTAAEEWQATAVRLDRWTGHVQPLNLQLWMVTPAGRVMRPGSMPAQDVEAWRAMAEDQRGAE
jgi:hypothetical protein